MAGVFANNSTGIGASKWRGWALAINDVKAAVGSTGKGFPGRGTVGQLQGISYSGTSTSIIGNDSTNGRHMQTGVRENTTDGSPAAPSLQLDFPGFWRFRWVVKAGTHSITVQTKQVANTAPFPSMIVKANPAVGLSSDLSASSAGGTGWTVIGPISFAFTGTGVVFVELHNNCLAYDSPALFDHIVIT